MAAKNIYLRWVRRYHAGDGDPSIFEEVEDRRQTVNSEREKSILVDVVRLSSQMTDYCGLRARARVLNRGQAKLGRWVVEVLGCCKLTVTLWKLISSTSPSTANLKA